MSKWKKSSEALVGHFLATMEEWEEIEHRKMFGYPCCFLNNNMFTGLHEENWILRLSGEDQAELGSKPFEPMKGRPMREYVILPKKILDDQDQLGSWLERSLEYVGTLPPKERKKRKKRS